jgi:hypothetical protein
MIKRIRGGGEGAGGEQKLIRFCYGVVTWPNDLKTATFSFWVVLLFTSRACFGSEPRNDLYLYQRQVSEGVPVSNVFETRFKNANLFRNSNLKLFGRPFRNVMACQ